MLLAISDASVLVDMADSDLLGPLTKLRYRFVVPDFVVREVQTSFRSSKLRVMTSGTSERCSRTTQRCHLQIAPS